MGTNVKFDTSDFDKKISKLPGLSTKQSERALFAMGGEALRLSSFEVPHDTGQLQNSGMINMEGDHAVVGYNKVYAARLHEHPEFNFQKGRKAKYLEDPVKRNLRIFRDIYQQVMSQIF